MVIFQGCISFLVVKNQGNIKEHKLAKLHSHGETSSIETANEY